MTDKAPESPRQQKPDAPARRPRRYSPHKTWLAVALLPPCLAVAAALIWSIGPVLLWYLGAINLTSFLLYWRDKSAARAGAGRVPELVLHLCALIGGAPGALSAGRVFRHKTRKWSFQAVYWATVALHLAGAIGGAVVLINARGADGATWTAFACGILAAVNIAAFVLEPKRRRGPAKVAGMALIVLGGALGAAIRDQRRDAIAWAPYLAGSAQLAAALWLATFAVRAWFT